MGRKPNNAFQSLLDEMVQVLREEILTGVWAKGEFLPSETALANRFHLSKKSIRKGLDILVAEGLIEKIPRVGNKVVNVPDKSATVIRFGYYPSLDTETELTKIIDDFHAEHPHIQIRMVGIPYEHFPRTVKEYLKNDMIDVFTVNYTDYQGLIDENALDLLEPLEDNPELYPFLTKPFQQDGRTYVLPMTFSPVILCYNRDHFREKHLPEPDSGWTWEDVMKAASELSDDKGKYGIYYHLPSKNRWPIFLLQAGMKFERYGDQRYSVCTPAFLEGIRTGREIIYRQGIVPSFVSESDTDTERLFLQQKVSMIITTYFGLNYLRDAEFVYDVSPLPRLSEPSTLLLIVGLAVHRNSGQKQAVQTLLRYLLSERIQLRIRLNTLSLPAHKRAAERVGDDERTRPSRFHMYREVIPSFRLFTDLGLSRRQLDTITSELRLYWSQMEDEAAVCDRLEQLL